MKNKELDITAKPFIQLAQQVSALITAYKNYEEIQKEVLNLLGTYAKANVIWSNKEGEVRHQIILLDAAPALPIQAGGVFLEPRLFSRLLQIGEGAGQLPLPFITNSVENGLSTASPHLSEKSNQCQVLILAPGDILLLYREGLPFGDEERALGEICLPVLIMLQRLSKERDLDEQQRQAQLVRAVMDTLSYTELEVVVRIFKALGGSEGVLIAGKFADGLGITRSVVVSALRKLESARIVETRSLGVKGTYIRVLNSLWMREIEKLRD